MHARTFPTGLMLLPLLGTIACSGVQKIRASPATDSDEARAAVLECCRSARLIPHEQLDFASYLTRGYGDKIRKDPELLEVFGGDFAMVFVYARQGHYELEVQPRGSRSASAGIAAEIEQCLRENVPDAAVTPDSQIAPDLR